MIKRFEEFTDTGGANACHRWLIPDILSQA
jgi:hypothetical protein